MATVQENILHSLKKNGFPQKKVALPFQAVFQACKREEIKLADVLNKLKAENVFSRVMGDKIHFQAQEFGESAATSDEKEEEFDFSNKMFKDAMDKIQEMDPEELQRIEQQMDQMSPEERAELLKRAKDLFKKPSKE